jgi:hypothetical protein
MLALDHAGNLVFEEYSDTDGEERLPSLLEVMPKDGDALGGYMVTVVRRGYSRYGSGSEYDADYSVLTLSEPLALFVDPDIVDQSPQYSSKLQELSLAHETPAAKPAIPKPRL